MKLIFTERALSNLQECLNFFPPEVSPEKINEIRDRILNKADKLLNNPTWASLKNTWCTLRKAIEELLKAITKLSTGSKAKSFM